MKRYKITTNQALIIQGMSISSGAIKTEKFYIGDSQEEQKIINKEELIETILAFKDVRAAEGKLSVVAIGKTGGVLNVVETEEDFKKVNNKDYNVHLVQALYTLIRQEDQIITAERPRTVKSPLGALNLYGNGKPAALFPIFGSAKIPSRTEMNFINNKAIQQTVNSSNKQTTVQKFFGIFSIFSWGSNDVYERSQKTTTIQKATAVRKAKDFENDFPTLELEGFENGEEHDEFNEDVAFLAAPREQSFSG